MSFSFPFGYDPTRDAASGEIGHCEFNEAAAGNAVAFVTGYIRHVEGEKAGQLVRLEPWQDELIRTLFGWKRPDGTRRYRIAYVEIPRKNGKTTLAAAIALYLLLCDGEQGAQVYCAAGTVDQASLCFRQAAGMIRQDKHLAARCKVLDTTKRIVVNNSTSFLRAIPGDDKGMHGPNPHGIIFDELHVQKDRLLWDALRSGTGARRQPLTIAITTAGHDKNSLCYEIHSHAAKVAKGEVCDPEFLPVVFAADDADDWRAPETWRKANPNLGVTVSESFLASEVARAVKLPSEENKVKQLYLNMWTESAERWISSAAWDSCRTADWPDLLGVPGFAAMDFGATSDLTAIARAWNIDGVYYTDCTCWIPEETMAEARKDYQKQYTAWARQGWLRIVPGRMMDYQYAERWMLDERERGILIQEVAFDEWNARATAARLDREGFTMVKVPQTFGGMAWGTKVFEDAILGETLRHGGNPVMDWMVACAMISQDHNGNRKPDKRKSCGEGCQLGKIDGVVATVMAIGRAALSVKEAPTDSLCFSSED